MTANCWEKHVVCLWAWGSSSSSSGRTFPPFPSSIDPPWLCRSQMKTSRYDLWDVISRGTSGVPPSLHLVREQPAGGQNQFPWVLGPDIPYHRRKQTGFIVNTLHYNSIPMTISLLLWSYQWRNARTIPHLIYRKKLLNICINIKQMEKKVSESIVHAFVCMRCHFSFIQQCINNDSVSVLRTRLKFKTNDERTKKYHSRL